MKTSLISIFLVVFIVSSGLQALGEEWTAEQNEVWASVGGFWESIKQGDVESAMAGYHDKALSLYSDNPSAYKKDQIRRSHSYWAHEIKPTFFKLEPIAINIIENVATVFYVFKWEAEKKRFHQRGRIFGTLIKQNNKWVSIGSLTSSCDKPAPCPYGW